MRTRLLPPSVSLGRLGNIAASLGAAMVVLPFFALASPFEPPHTFEATEPIVAADFNESFSTVAAAVNDNDSRISALEGGSAVVARCASSAATPLPQGEQNRINFDQCGIDSHDAVTTGAAWAFVAPRAGTYRVSARYDTDTLPSSIWTAELGIFVGDELYSASTLQRSDDGQALRAHVEINDIVSLAEGDALYLSAFHNRNAEHTLRGNPDYVFVAINEVR